MQVTGVHWNDRCLLWHPRPRSAYVETDSSPAQMVASASPGAVGPTASTTGASETGSPILIGGQQLNAGQNIYNPVNGYSLVMGGDGNLVLYAPGNVVRFASNTAGNPGAHVAMQDDGNLVVYSSANVALWSTHTGGNPGAFFILQQDDNGVIFSTAHTPLFTTNTCLSCT